MPPDAQRASTERESPDGIWSDEPVQPAQDTLFSRLLPGGCILDVPPVPDAVWGDGEDILWAKGQSLIIAGPDGVGKTTLAGNLVQARLGLGLGDVLGQPVKQGERNVLVLLMDRPSQAMAALARLFTPADRPILDARLRVWRGPPPEDLARNTGMLRHLCMLAGADTCLIDSLKDAALKLSDDEAGAGWNQARQLAIEAGTEVVELHHPRKGQEANRKPSKLDDLYGSRWIPAGAGSVISLWGEAGDPVVELTHLKPVVSTVGPWKMSSDGTTGLVSIGHQVDLVQVIRSRGAQGITAAQAATVLEGTEKPTAAQIEKARRRLNRKAAEGVLLCQPGQPGGTRGGASNVVPRWPGRSRKRSRAFCAGSVHGFAHGAFTRRSERSRPPQPRAFTREGGIKYPPPVNGPREPPEDAQTGQLRVVP